MKFIKTTIFSLLCASITLASCSEEGPDAPGREGQASEDANIPAYSSSLPVWNGERADDFSADAVGQNADLYHELSTFGRKIEIEYSGATATVTSQIAGVKTDVSGAYVTIDMKSANVSGVEIILKGSSADGGLKIYGANRFLLTLSGLNLESRKGPAINSQCKKRMFVRLAEGSVNTLADAKEYEEDDYYLPGETSYTEDRKGCLFSEGDVIFSGNGVLEVKGRYRHGIATDGFMAIRPGVTLAVTEAARNCYHANGDLTDDIGILVMGGYVFGTTTAPAGKGMKCDRDIRIEGGKVVLGTSGDAIYDEETFDTSSAACLKADAGVKISGGNVSLRSLGKGGKGINAGTTIDISGGKTEVVCSGTRYEYAPSLTSSAKAIKATEDITLTGGELLVISSGKADGSRGMESDAAITVSDCMLSIYSHDDAINAYTIKIDGQSSILAYSAAEDGLNAKQSVSIAGGQVIAAGGSSPASGVDCKVAEGVNVAGGTLVAMGGAPSTEPVVSGVVHKSWTGFSAKVGESVAIASSNGANTLMSFVMPRSYEGASLLVASQSLDGADYFSAYCGGKQCVKE